MVDITSLKENIWKQLRTSYRHLTFAREVRLHKTLLQIHIKGQGVLELGVYFGKLKSVATECKFFCFQYDVNSTVLIGADASKQILAKFVLDLFKTSFILSLTKWLKTFFCWLDV
jgi:hypothetical protein